MGAHVTRVTQLQVATIQKGAVCQELSGISVFSQRGTSPQEGSWFFPQPLNRDWSKAGVKSQEEASASLPQADSQQGPLIQRLL